jgi:hypothetical protein
VGVYAKVEGGGRIHRGDAVGSSKPVLLQVEGHSLEGSYTTYEYYPYRFLPFSKFQVFCEGGLVTGVVR